ncbi:hypothetical protein HanRHA438_Chr04g0198971 [Helianthus annuus]|nr:hypothetical protein HanRHA438_Chr04g0198971 [Helianthus annuus]
MERGGHRPKTPSNDPFIRRNHRRRRWAYSHQSKYFRLLLYEPTYRKNDDKQTQRAYRNLVGNLVNFTEH